jgi:hypothetical protein
MCRKLVLSGDTAVDVKVQRMWRFYSKCNLFQIKVVLADLRTVHLYVIGL